ncbi:MAG: hypothetical protein JWR59_1084 [Brevundimonas sp.]|nr:hypothetical protein [Brevundimonas sp.]
MQSTVWRSGIVEGRNPFIASRVFQPMQPTSKEEIELDRLWREAFKQPLPMLGAPDIARAILEEHQARSARAAD